MNLFLSKLPFKKYYLILFLMDMVVYLADDHFRIFVFEDLLHSVLLLLPLSPHCPHPLLSHVGGFLEMSVVTVWCTWTES